MRWCTAMLLAGVVVALATPDGSAQIFGSKKPKTPPQQRVPELIVALKFDKDAHKRADAAEELRQFETKEFPEIIPILIEALQNDPVARVRIEAATSLGRMRPISVPAGQALEKAGASDSNLGVRLQAKTSFVWYQLSGYHAPKKNEATGPALVGRTDEPPLAAPNDPSSKNGPGTGKQPPLLPGSSNAYKPLPPGTSVHPQVPVVTVPSPQAAPTQGPVIQTVPPILQPPPAWSPVSPIPPLPTVPPGPDVGPSLMPPKN
jgi:HEAT repeats